MTNKDPSATLGNMTRNRQMVEVDGFLGGEHEEFGLNSLLPSMLGGDAYTEVYVDTESGNRYAVLEEDYIHPETDAPYKQFVLMNGRELSSSASKGNTSLPVHRLSEDVVGQAVLKVGEAFDYGQGHTTRISSITCVNSSRHYNREYLDQLTRGESSSARSEFWALANLKPPHGQES